MTQALPFAVSAPLIGSIRYVQSGLVSLDLAWSVASRFLHRTSWIVRQWVEYDAADFIRGLADTASKAANEPDQRTLYLSARRGVA